MSMEIKARDLRAAGWADDRRIGGILRRARELERTGLARAEALAVLGREHPRQPALTTPRATPAPLAEAILAEEPAEQANLSRTRERMFELLKLPVVKRGALMPDACPAGAARATVPVGGALEVENALIPGAHSADICCSLFATFFAANHPAAEIMDHLQSVTHFGAGGRCRGQQLSSAVVAEAVWDNPFLRGLECRAREHLGTQGDGNHFAYVGQIGFTEAQCAALVDAGHTGPAETITRHGQAFHVLVTHHGSRGLGADVYKRGQPAAQRWCAQNARDIPDAAAWLPADCAEGVAYWEALQYVARWTRANHTVIHEALLRRLGSRALLQIGNEHNFVWRRGDIFLHGKGATPAWRDAEGRPLLGLIPLNMAREILIVIGANNDRYLSFCPHGAGRNLSRRAMLAPYRDAEGELDPTLVRKTIEATTAGLDIRWFGGTPDLSEAPPAYKDATKVKEQIARFGLADVVGEIRPLGCIMAGQTDEPYRQRARREKRAAHKAARRTGGTHGSAT